MNQARDQPDNIRFRKLTFETVSIRKLTFIEKSSTGSSEKVWRLCA
jgi:hypothetical protein